MKRAVALTAFALAATAAGEAFFKLKNINQTEQRPYRPEPRGPLSLSVNGVAVFAANTTGNAGTGVELWRTDATAEGTMLVKDLNPGIASSNPSEAVRAGSLWYFSADDGTRGVELWKTDGTDNGTAFIADLRSGPLGSNPEGLVALGSRLLFTADDGSTGRELYSTDGTPTGTVQLRDFAALGASSSFAPAGVVSGRFYFAVNDGASGNELWSTDGTPNGTRLEANIAPGALSSNPSGFTVLGDVLVFSANDQVSGDEPWVFHTATQVASRLVDLAAGASSSSPGPFVTSGDVVYFRAFADGIGDELFKTDGTAEGTALVRDIDAAPGGSGSPLALVPLAPNKIVFTATFPDAGREAWVSDGTPGATFMLGDRSPGPVSTYPRTLVADAGRVCWYDCPSCACTEICETRSGFTGIVPHFRSLGTRVLFSGPNLLNAQDPFDSQSDAGFAQGWVTDGTLDGTVALNVGTSATTAAVMHGTSVLYAANNALVSHSGATPQYLAFASAPPKYLSTLGAKVLFGADQGYGVELFQTGGTVPTTAVIPSSALPTPSHPTNYIAALGKVFFLADDGVHGREVWVTDGSPENTVMLRDFTPGSQGANARLSPDAVLNGKLYFAADNSLWTTDGTPSGTALVPSAYYLNPFYVAAVGTHIFFTSGTVAYRTNGTTTVMLSVPYTGTDHLGNGLGVLGFTGIKKFGDSVLVGVKRNSATIAEPYFGVLLFDGNKPAPSLQALYDGSGTIFPPEFGSVGSLGLFTRTLSIYISGGLSMWATSVFSVDGSGSGATLLSDMVRSSCPTLSAPAHDFVTAGSRAYFTSSMGCAGEELAVTDGTPVGTALFKDFVVGTGSSFAKPGTSKGNTAYASVGRELWSVDGTPDGSVLIRAFAPDAGGPSQLFTARNGWVFFAAHEALSGRELWATDGTPARTALVNDFSPGLGSSDPSEFVEFDGGLVFTAKDSFDDVEPFVMLFDTSPPVVRLVPSVDAGSKGFFTQTVSYRFDITEPEGTLWVEHGCDGGVLNVDGEVEVTCVATSRGGTTSYSGKVRRDATAPSVTCPQNQVAEATAHSGAVVVYSADASDNGPKPTLTAVPTSGSSFGFGDSGVTITAVDQAGNTATCGFWVTVRDTQAPFLTCPRPITVTAPSQPGAVVNYAVVTVGDLGDPSPAVTYSPASGSLFPIGTTTVTATAKDSANNVAQCSFQVRVEPCPGCDAGVGVADAGLDGGDASDGGATGDAGMGELDGGLDAGDDGTGSGTGGGSGGSGGGGGQGAGGCGCGTTDSASALLALSMLLAARRSRKVCAL